MPAQQKKRRKKRRMGIIILLFAAAIGYIGFILLTEPERLTLGFGGPGTASAPAKESEPDKNIKEEDPLSYNKFAVFSFYITEKLSAYEAFETDNPRLTAEEVVWMVNACLDRPFYTEAVIIEDPYPLLVNPFNRLPDYFEPHALETIDSHGRQVTPETLSAFRKMQEGAVKAGYRLSAQSAYRTIEYQRGLYERNGGTYPPVPGGSVAPPGYSEHHTGRTIDLWGPDGLLDSGGPTDTGRWVAENAYIYGFIIRYTEENRPVTGYISEPWHITYVGEHIAGEMRRGGYGSLEEYIAKNPGAKLPEAP